MYVSSAALNYANEAGIKLDNAFRKATQQLSIDATNDASRWTQQKYEDTQSPANKLWRWLGIDGSWLPAAGDVWMLGEHRLMCGDSTSADDFAKLMDGEKADLMITDPPYNVNYMGKTKDALQIKNDNMADIDFGKLLEEAFNNSFQCMKAGGGFYVWHSDMSRSAFQSALSAEVRQVLIWVKNAFVLGRQDYQWKHEPCLYGWKDGATHYFVKSRKEATVLENVDIPTTVIRENRPSRNSLHPTMKPVPLIGRLIHNSSRSSEIVIDPFGGSGTTLIACEQLSRKCYMMELDERYC